MLIHFLTLVSLVLLRILIFPSWLRDLILKIGVMPDIGISGGKGLVFGDDRSEDVDFDKTF